MLHRHPVTSGRAYAAGSHGKLLSEGARMSVAVILPWKRWPDLGIAGMAVIRLSLIIAFADLRVGTAIVCFLTYREFGHAERR